MIFRMFYQKHQKHRKGPEGCLKDDLVVPVLSVQLP